MAEKTISIEFDGYWRDEKKSSVPAKSGVYCVYACTHDKTAKKVSIRLLIYIGESANMEDRIANHEKRDKWEKKLQSGEVLCYSAGEIGATDRERAEAAMIFEHKPPVNVEYKDCFPFDKTTMKLSGQTAKLKTNFTVDRVDC